MSRADLDILVGRVLANPALEARLGGKPLERDTLIGQVLTLANEEGLSVTAADISAALRDNRRAFLIAQKRILT